jgi:hypothetical protein
MSNLLKNTKVVAGIAVLLVLAVGYWYWSSTSTAPQATVTAVTSPASQELLTMLGNLHSLELNPAVFQDPLFTSLSDFGVTIPSQPTGRRNPFAPPGL